MQNDETTATALDGSLLIGANGEVTRLEVLRALAWAAPLTSGQVRRIVAPAMRGENFGRRVLTPLAQAGLIAGTYHYETVQRPGRSARCRRPRRVGLVWELTAEGFRVIAGDDKAPQRPAVMRGAAVLGHDLVLGEVITRVIEWTRPILSSIYVEHEDRLDEARRRPIADALMVVRYAPTRVLPGIVPWKNLPPAPGEDVRFYAIEVDRGTEEYEVIDGKALNYRRVRNDPSFYERYGSMFPGLLITVPTESRRRGWDASWRRLWPYGKWLIATEADLTRDRWFEHDNGVERWRTFVDGWQPAPAGRDDAGRAEAMHPQPAEQAGSPPDDAAASSSADAAADSGYWAKKLQDSESSRMKRRRRG